MRGRRKAFLVGRDRTIKLYARDPKTKNQKAFGRYHPVKEEFMYRGVKYVKESLKEQLIESLQESLKVDREVIAKRGAIILELREEVKELCDRLRPLTTVGGEEE